MRPYSTSAEKPPIEYSSRQFLRDAWHLLASYRGRFAFATAMRVVADIVWLYPAFALASIITFFTTYSPGDSLREVYIILGIWIAVSVVHYGGHFLAKYLGYLTAEQVSLDAQFRTLKHLLLLDISWHERDNAGNKIKRIQKGGQGIEQMVRMWITNAIEIIVNFFGMIGIIAAIHLEISIAMLVFLVTYFFISFFVIKKASVAAHVVNVKEEDVHGLSFETANNIRSVKVMSMIPPLTALIRRELNDLAAKIKRRVYLYQIRNLTILPWAQAFRIGTIIYIVFGIAHGRFEVGLLVLFYSYFNKIWQSVAELSDFAQEFTTAKYGVGRMMAIMNEPVGTDNEGEKRLFPKAWERISFRDVSFAYGEEDVLRNISFDIKRGERIGVVGLSGAGKSTLLKLLLKEREDYSGQILIDDIPLTSISKKDYFNHTAVVLQDTEVFNLSLRDNIVISNIKEEKNEKMLQRSLDISHVSDFLHKLPKGLQTFIGEKGFRLSGGERQRVGLARAIFKDPEILFLDEATSHLDLESEEKIQDSLHTFFQDVTAIVIAHRLTTIREMDMIIVIEDGVIIEQGTFDELQSKRGRFFELWEKQRL